MKIEEITDSELEDLDKELAELESLDDENKNNSETGTKEKKVKFSEKMNYFESKWGKYKGFCALGVIVLGLLIAVVVYFTGNSATKQTVQNAGSIESVTSGNDDTAKNLFKKSIASAVDGQAGKYSVSVEWKRSTLAYSESGDTEKFKKELVKINETRAKLYTNITGTTELDNFVKKSLDNQKLALQKAYESKTVTDAIKIYNEWNESDLALDNKYIEILTSQLEQVGLKYTIEETEEGKILHY